MKNKDFSNTWTGDITLEDFNTSVPNKNRIRNQYSANLFYENLRKKNGEKETMKKYTSMTLEELKSLRLISNTNGRPTESMTDEKWQQEFEIRKLLARKHDPSVKTLKGLYSRKNSTWNEETQGTYHGETSWQQYCSFINDVLKNIKQGHFDYLYFIYQIDELLKFDFGNRELKTRYCDGYWEVWLA